jgi:hypothetical protein
VNQNEEFTAVMRQMQKHALLFASGDGLTAGDWKPAFLSDWIRCALLVRAWLKRMSLPEAGKWPELAALVARARRARIAYRDIFPDVCGRPDASVTDELVEELVRQADRDSPEACENFWSLLAGLGDADRPRVTVRPKRVPEMTDLSGLEFDGLSRFQKVL